MLGLKGHSGFRPCLVCTSIVLWRYWPARLRGCVDHTSLDQPVLHMVASFMEVLRRLRDGFARLSAQDFAELQRVHGVNYTPDGLLFAPDLGVTPLNVMSDWCHTYLVGGLVDVELGVLMHELRRLGAPTS